MFESMEQSESLYELEVFNIRAFIQFTMNDVDPSDLAKLGLGNIEQQQDPPQRSCTNLSSKDFS